MNFKINMYFYVISYHVNHYFVLIDIGCFILYYMLCVSLAT